MVVVVMMIVMITAIDMRLIVDGNDNDDGIENDKKNTKYPHL